MLTLRYNEPVFILMLRGRVGCLFLYAEGRSDWGSSAMNVWPNVWPSIFLQPLVYSNWHLLKYGWFELIWEFFVNDQRDAQIISTYLFLLIILYYVFRAHRAHHQERQIVSIQPLVTVILRWWPRCVQVGSRLSSRGCIDTICLSWWWARCARNM